MKYLSDYTEQATSAALNKAGAFFAFSNKQFNEQRVDGVEYSNAGAGCICPTDNVATLVMELSNGHKAGIALDIAENGKEAIIRRELYNHEAFYTGDWKGCIFQGALNGYDISDDDVYAVYKTEYHVAMASGNY